MTLVIFMPDIALFDFSGEPLYIYMMILRVFGYFELVTPKWRRILKATIFMIF